jgi:hypothetical protein
MKEFEDSTKQLNVNLHESQAKVNKIIIYYWDIGTDSILLDL